ncbi:hypothetical protein ACS0TY_024602 [Phlomoides rotata]
MKEEENEIGAIQITQTPPTKNNISQTFSRPIRRALIATEKAHDVEHAQTSFKCGQGLKGVFTATEPPDDSGLQIFALLYLIVTLCVEDVVSVLGEATSGYCGQYRRTMAKILDGTYIDVRVPTTDKGRYRNRKGQTFVNVLGVCDMNMKFVYVLTSLEGSAGDSRVLRNAITRVNGLKVPKDNYYLCDNGYLNCDGFLTPYKGVRYHLNEWTL